LFSSDLSGQKCIIKYELNPLSWQKESTEYYIVDVDNEWIKVFLMDKKGIGKSRIIRIKNIEDVELL